MDVALTTFSAIIITLLAAALFMALIQLWYKHDQLNDARDDADEAYKKLDQARREVAARNFEFPPRRSKKYAA